ncbi:uncharacterized protein BJ171DRAFT_525153 [Polychytrium aggregatum]|uniref:uncharacterized protein n=1 Tax=Polychytrium aggregatum TaxID=110093 RepID=UPI0022FE6AED|nr:uncharacterized protein BJ171DRAFT_525153 [Polychytrium aggregatum]KAI9193595.1 hypothetical protein BJ171DRAFT_525153 [Polychytrium aggregatum]
MKPFLSQITSYPSFEDPAKHIAFEPPRFLTAGQSLSSSSHVETISAACIEQRLDGLPLEICETIFVYASNPQLAHVCRRFRRISQSAWIRARFLLQKYPTSALAKCWGYPFMRALGDRPCRCGDRKVQAAGLARIHPRLGGSLLKPDVCPLEQHQIKVCSYLIDLGAGVDRGGQQCLRHAVADGHMCLLDFFLSLGIDPDVQLLPKMTIAKRVLGVLKPQSRSLVVDEADPAVDDAGPAMEAAFTPQFGTAGPAASVQIVVEVQEGPGPSASHPPQPLPLPLPPPLLLPAPTQVALPAAPLARNSRRRPMKNTLLIQAVQSRNVPLVRKLASKRHVIHRCTLTRPQPTATQDTAAPSASTWADPTSTLMHNPASLESPKPDLRIRVSQIHPLALSEALDVALMARSIQIAEILVSEGARATSRTVQKLIRRGTAWRLTLGVRERYSGALVLAIQTLPDSEFRRLEGFLMRSCAEIGAVSAVKACVDRGGDVNVWDGIPLYTSIYNGNLEVNRYLLSVNATTDYFDWRQKLFCLTLMSIEAFAIALFLILAFIWITGVVCSLGQWVGVTPATGNRLLSGWGGDPGTTMAELTAMATPSALALILMYRLAPFHRMCIGFVCTCREDRRRKIMRRRNMTTPTIE